MASKEDNPRNEEARFNPVPQTQSNREREGGHKTTSAMPGEAIEIICSKVGKRFRRQWVLRDLDHRFAAGSCTAITGPNGSGKSTLLRLLSGLAGPTSGSLSWSAAAENIPVEALVGRIAIAAPYLELIEEFSLREMFHFQDRFRAWRAGFDVESVHALLGLEAHRDKPLHQFSSGMKQRVKLALALQSDAQLVLLDEPASNLDASGFQWYRSMLDEQRSGRTIIIASNRSEEYAGYPVGLDLG